MIVYHYFLDERNAYFLYESRERLHNEYLYGTSTSTTSLYERVPRLARTSTSSTILNPSETDVLKV